MRKTCLQSYYDPLVLGKGLKPGLLNGMSHVDGAQGTSVKTAGHCVKQPEQGSTVH